MTTTRNAFEQIRDVLGGAAAASAALTATAAADFAGRR
jgi:hypothetical protein